MASGNATSLPDVPLVNPAKLPADLLLRLWNDLEPLREVEEQLGYEALQYVVDGEPAGVLDQMRATKHCGGALRLPLCSADSPERPHFIGELFKRCPIEHQSLIHRLALVYEAASTIDRASHVSSRQTPSSGVPYWLEYFLEVVTGFNGVWYSSVGPRVVSYDMMESLLKFANLPSDRWVQIWMHDDAGQIWPYFANRIEHLVDPGVGLSRHGAPVLERLKGNAKEQVFGLERLARHAKDLTPFTEALVTLAVDGAKTVRAAAEPLLANVIDAAAPHLRRIAEAGAPSQRILACQILSRRQPEQAADFLRQRCEADPAQKVREAIKPLVPHTESKVPTDDLVPPPLEPLPMFSPMSPAARERLKQAWEDRWKEMEEGHKKHGWPLAPRPTEEDLAAVVHILENGTDKPPRVSKSIEHFLFAKNELHPDTTLLHAVRLAWLRNRVNDRERTWDLNACLTARPGTHFDLRHLAWALQSVGWPVDFAGEVMWEWHHPESMEMDAALIWPFFNDHPELLIEKGWSKLGAWAWTCDHRRKCVMRIIAMFPRLPAKLAGFCWDIAFTGSRIERPLAQDALANDRERNKKVIASLAAGRAEHRGVAAEWLGRIGCREAVAPLKAALKKEKQEATAGLMMRALELLGAPLEDFISLDGLLKNAKALIEKGIPKNLAWFNFTDLPAVHWKTGKRVQKEIVTGLILQSLKLGSAEPGPKLRMIAGQFAEEDRAALGKFVLEKWIAHDTVPHTHADADAAAKRMLAQFGMPQSYYQEIYNSLLNSPVDSAQGEKGILAVAGACCDGRVAGTVLQYLRTYYGNRAAQCKSLIRMLSWIDDPSAIQVLLSVAGRFRTAGIRKEAEIVVNQLAERKSWTLDELADRSIPSAGFEEDQTQTLDFGPRQFTAKLKDDLTIALTDEEGKAIKSLPAPRQSDDAALAAAAKKKLSAANKELKAVAKLQRDRLYDAMCSQRTWTFADWDRFLHRHAVAGHLCRRLVWAVRADDKITQTFRPLGDGTLTDVNDETLKPGEGDLICLAHACTVEPSAGEAWHRHLADYEIVPLFTQFGQGVYTLPDPLRNETKIDDFRGHMLEAFKLRNRLTRHGYTRGQAEDGGWFFTYNKHLASMGITATIAFSGSSLPEENRNVALAELTFTRTAPAATAYATPRPIPLGQIPVVLLSECWNDLRLAAAEGTGFEADWEKKLH